MLEIKGPEADLGVIVGRFQTPYLTPGHTELIETVRDRHKKFLICLGNARVIPSKTNPLDFATRSAMVQEAYPGTIILPIGDTRADVDWSNNLDALIRTLFPHEKVVLYGGRDSFALRYHGKFKTVELKSPISESGTHARKEAAHQVLSSRDFRAGICYALANRYPSLFPTVDTAVTEDDTVLLGRKKEDGLQWRFLGGHINPGEDAATAGRREAMEESGCDIGQMIHIGSVPIKDWRYEGTGDGIFTTFYEARYMGGSPKGADDINEVKWLHNKDLSAGLIVPEHHILLDLYLRHKGLRGVLDVQSGYEVKAYKYDTVNGVKIITSPIPADQVKL